MPRIKLTGTQLGDDQILRLIFLRVAASALRLAQDLTRFACARSSSALGGGSSSRHLMQQPLRKIEPRIKD